MFVQDQYRTLLAYHFDTVLRLLNCASQLDEADYHDYLEYGHGSVHELLFHVLVTDHRWRVGMETGQRMPVLQKAEYPDLLSIKAFFEIEKQAWMNYHASLTEEEIKGDIKIVASNGNEANIPRWRILSHVVLHGMQHAAEMAEILTQNGQSPGDIDFIFYE